jgi:peptidoglycan/LPS O-acetylase OafA/YrhL
LAVLLLRKNWLWLLITSLLVMYLWRHAAVVLLADSPISARVIASWQLPGAFDMFGIGMLAAVAYVHRQQMPAWLNRSLLKQIFAVAAVMVLVFATYWLAANRYEFWADNPIFYLWTPVVSTATAVLILTGMTGGRLTQLLFGNRVMVFLGLISYSFYLWHLPVIDWISATPWLDKLAGPTFWGRFALSFVLSLAISTLSYLMIERPCMKLWRR